MSRTAAAPRRSTALRCWSPPSSRPAEPLTFADLQEACDLPKSTTSRMLTALERVRAARARRRTAATWPAACSGCTPRGTTRGEDLVRLAGPTLERDRRGDPRDRQPQRGPRRPGRAGRPGRLAVPPRHPRLDPGRRARALLLARQGLPRLGRRRRCPTGRSRRRPTRTPHRPGRAARRRRAQPAAAAGRSPSTSSRSGSPASPYPSADPRPGGRGARRLGTDHRLERPVRRARPAVDATTPRS